MFIMFKRDRTGNIDERTLSFHFSKPDSEAVKFLKNLTREGEPNLEVWEISLKEQVL